MRVYQQSHKRRKKTHTPHDATQNKVTNTSRSFSDLTQARARARSDKEPTACGNEHGSTQGQHHARSHLNAVAEESAPAPLQRSVHLLGAQRLDASAAATPAAPITGRQGAHEAETL